jgi:TonB family protein
MFETSVVREQAAVASRRASMLSVSLAAHALVIVGAVGMSIATVDVPRSAPDQFAAFQISTPVVVPPPLGRPDGGQKPAAQPQPQKPSTPPPAVKDAAPAIVPETVPTADANPSSNASGPVGEGPSGPGSDAPWGDPNGDPNSVGTDLNAIVPATPQQPVEEKIYTVGGEVRAPRLVRRSEPRFPPALLRAGVHGTVKVQCIIDRNGRLRDPKIVFSSQPMLNQAVLDSLPEWRFEPASLNGNAVDAYFDLTVTFSFRR